MGARPESPVGARRDRLRKAAPALELNSRYVCNDQDPGYDNIQSPLGGNGERPTRHSDRWRKAVPAQLPGAQGSERLEQRVGGRRMDMADGERLKPEDNMDKIMRVPSARAASPRSSRQAISASWLTHEEPGSDEVFQRRARRGASQNEMELPDSERHLLQVFESRRTESQASDGPAPRDVVVGQRILGQLLGRKEKLRNVLRLMDATNTGRMTFQDFSEGLHSAGVFLGEADRRSVWADAGGAIVACEGAHKLDRMPAGEVDMVSFMSRLEQGAASDDWAKKKMQGAGYSHHMQSSLTKGLAVRDDVQQFDTTGGGMHLRRASAVGTEPDQHHNESVHHRSPSPEPWATPSGGQGDARAKSRMRWSLNEEHYRDLIRQRKDAIKKMFGANSRAADASEARGASMTFQEFKGGLRTAGVMLSDTDLEGLWRRVDAECIGQVNYANIAEAFDLTDRRSAGEPGGSRALPHFSQREAAASEAPLERHAGELASSLAAERVARAILGDVPAAGHTSTSINHEGGKHHYTSSNSRPKAKQGTKLWHVVKATLDSHPQHLPLDADLVHRSLNAAGAVVSKADTSELWQRARQLAVKRQARGGGDGMPGVEDLEAVLEAAATVQTPGKEKALLSFGSQHQRSMCSPPAPAPAAEQEHCSSRVADVSASAGDAMGAAARMEAQSKVGAESETNLALHKLASGFLGNPHRLRQVFKKFDLDVQGRISGLEFVRALADQTTTLTHRDMQVLAAAAQDPGGVVDYEAFCQMMAGQAAVRGRSAGAGARAGSEGADVVYNPITHTNLSLADKFRQEPSQAQAHPNYPAAAAAAAAAAASGHEPHPSSPRTSNTSSANRRQPDSPRAGRGPAASPRRGGGSEAGGEGLARSVQRERSSASMRSSMSACSASSALGGSGPSDRSTWMHNVSRHRPDAHRRIVRSCSPAPSSRGSYGSAAEADNTAHSAARTVQFAGSAANMASGSDPARFRILHLAGGPPLAMHARARSSLLAA